MYGAGRAKGPFGGMTKEKLEPNRINGKALTLRGSHHPEATTEKICYEQMKLASLIKHVSQSAKSGQFLSLW